MINCFIIAFLVICVGYGLPDGFLLKRINQRIQRFTDYWALGGSWGFFAPDPAMENHQIVAMIHLRDGRKLLWKGALLQNTTVIYGFLNMRRRQWETCLFMPLGAGIRKGHCEMLLRKYREAGDDPIRIELGIERIPIPPIGVLDIDPSSVQRELLYTYEVEAKQEEVVPLKRAA